MELLKLEIRDGDAAGTRMVEQTVRLSKNPLNWWDSSL